MGRATMYDVAEAAGVSTTTVSRVLNESPLVADHTRQKVLSAMRRLLYRPDDRARALGACRSAVRGVDEDAPPRAVRFEGRWSPEERTTLMRTTGWGERRRSAPAGEAHWVCVASSLNDAPVYMALRAPGVTEPLLAASVEALSRMIVETNSNYHIPAFHVG